MFLYSLTLQPPTTVGQAIVGQFSGTGEQQILTASGSRLALLSSNPALSQVITICSQDLFSIIRSVASVRLAGTTKDYIILTADSGSIAVVEFVAAQRRFSRVQLETFGKSGVRRVVPGQYLAADPKGRACLVASVERSKFIYVLDRNAQAELTISSPLVAHRQGTIVLSLIALDVGYENPVFASLETHHSKLDQDLSGQTYPDVELVYYELDLGVNHVVRKWSEPVDPTSSLLFQVPGGNDGPSGVLVCAEDTVTYHHSNQETLRVSIPRRRGTIEDPNWKRSIVSGVVHKLKSGAGTFFALLQTEDGDIFKVTLGMRRGIDENPTSEVGVIKIKYFDSIPVSSSLCILKSGFLFASCEFGNHNFYEIEKLGDDDEPEFTSDNSSPSGTAIPTYFHPRPLENLTMVQTIDSMSPLLDSKTVNLLEEHIPRIYATCGNGARSRFRVLKHGLKVQEHGASELPGRASGVWATKLSRHDKHDRYIILTWSKSTSVMSIGEELDQISDSGLLTSVPTLAVQQMGEDGLVQIHPKGIRHLQNGKMIDWHTPQSVLILAAAANEQQVAIALSSGEIVYFEIDSSGTLTEYDGWKKMSGTVTCLSLGQLPTGHLRSPFLAVGSDDCTLRILSLDPESTLDRELADIRHKFIGLKGIKLSQITINGQKCVLALGITPWVGYVDPAKGFMMTPLLYKGLEAACSLRSRQFEEGVIGIQENSLRVFSVQNIHDNMVQESVPLTYTPQQLVKHPDQPYLYGIESENNTLAPQLRVQLREDPIVFNEISAVLPSESFGYPRAHKRWASCINVIEPLGEEPQTLQRIDLENNEAAVSAAVVSFASQNGELFLVVGTGKDIVLNPRNFSAGYIWVYRFRQDGRELEFIHKSEVEEPPMALLSFQGRLAAGIGKVLRIYDLGLKKLLRKAEAVVTQQLIVSLSAQGSRIAVGDIQQGITLVVYKPNSNILVPFVDDSVARWTTCTTMVDYETIAGGDKFGNVWILRCPENVSAKADDPDFVGHLGREHLHGAPDRLTLISHFFTQDIPTSISKASFAIGGKDILLWTGLQGTIGVLIPLVTRSDAELFHALEAHMRTADPPVTGRDHLMYRSSYMPVKGVIDGDLCERYALLADDKKQMIADQLGHSVLEMERKISDARHRFAF
ncbi:uncharacterized protein JN550_005426 [Neoarthrinium moseri]|uniref:uncharacterized protein n=1 Tax=Neoarthrinium moseri TaxID=1658444 RepID=UPI001FDCC1BC|nr:uncharacterized protein JN550_005426 [Neoarthrinium moseri]KAI1869836.1 hypothetical protein JN550_005426 [Neoarthrinium moseri]